MELTMADQPNAVPWEVPSAEIKPGTPTTPDDGEYLPGRAYFSRLGVVRRKPARGDAEPTFSKSCSDKLALKQCTSLLGALTSLYVDVSGAYIDTLVISRPRYSETGCDRAFGAHGRMAPVKGAQWPRGYSFKPFKVETTDEEFFFSKTSVLQRSDKIAASNLATLWSHSGLVETILAGVIRGRRPFDIRGASCVSRLQIWATAEALARHLAGDDVDEVELVKYATYKQVKEGQFLAARRQVKAETRSTALAGWITDDRDSEFAISV
jgi:tRNA-specific adenosine deaminase 1